MVVAAERRSPRREMGQPEAADSAPSASVSTQETSHVRCLGAGGVHPGARGLGQEGCTPRARFHCSFTRRRRREALAAITIAHNFLPLGLCTKAVLLIGCLQSFPSHSWLQSEGKTKNDTQGFINFFSLINCQCLPAGGVHNPGL